MDRLDYGTDPEHPRVAMLSGKQRINLRSISITKDEWLTADHEAARSDDIRFLTETSPDDVVAHLYAGGVEVLAGPIARDGALGKLTSVYRRYPNGSLIEFSSYAGDVAGNVD